ncbi:DUF1127 domain-containing protein [Pseudomonas kairouanensis]|uniref:DUF1127 domain-containing protein n=1 Tax=Pseudomonas kairouanensis TaxID=2293832 RepID=A0A4Z0AHE2_9PSED|nr:DUF1127 domain-containing protein [Pseudomonas kairouanensis]TFY86206.1 DUF1127 domain-containing protein [Pseudomonas kairouanensis]
MDTQTPPLYRRLLSTTARTLAKWARHAHERRQLAQLDRRELSDVGISPSDRLTELAKPFWRD